MLRWDRPAYGILLPGHFIGVAESTGLIGKDYASAGRRSRAFWLVVRRCCDSCGARASVRARLSAIWSVVQSSIYSRTAAPKAPHNGYELILEHRLSVPVLLRIGGLTGIQSGAWSARSRYIHRESCMATLASKWTLTY